MESSTKAPYAYKGKFPGRGNALIPGTRVRVKHTACAYRLPEGLETNDEATIIWFDCSYEVEKDGKRFRVTSTCIAAHYDVEKGDWIEGSNTRRPGYTYLTLFTERTRQKVHELLQSNSPADTLHQFLHTTHIEAVTLGFRGQLKAWEWLMNRRGKIPAA